MKILSREDILKSPLRTKKVEIDAWGGEVIVRELAASDIAEFNKARKTGDIEGDEIFAYYIVFGIVDEDGNKVFGLDDVDALMHTSFDALKEISQHIMELSGLGSEKK